jgi:hypothetical protein
VGVKNAGWRSGEGAIMRSLSCMIKDVIIHDNRPGRGILCDLGNYFA